MIPLKNVIGRFRGNFHGYQVLKDKTKKRLIRKVSQFWHIEQSKLPERNKQLRKEEGLD